MKYCYIYLFLSSFFSCYSQSTAEIKAIRIEHIGESDKPIFTVVICVANYKPVSYERIVVLSSNLFRTAFDYVEKNQTGKIDPDSYEFGVFKIITQRSTGDDKYYVLPSRSFSIDYLKKLKQEIPAQQTDFHEAIKNLLIRIRLE